ncbi:helix-turn-helix domain-containing protein [Chryseobacterium populi]|uniref:DNA-binding domain-containing protein, AraC-type n=1 Tax=Chryseobacterium populi TaxID=1144316 RepID=J3CMC9_9FLAO|nr:helix-turn-helix domain-containing protein [Chryseobacterium populi]EJL74421.1 DNA-binding domain-containing protein, AraC-type [Chryseobacterium populi]
MNILDSKLQDAVARFARLPFQTNVYNLNLYDQVLNHNAVMLKERLKFLIALDLAPLYNYYKQEVFISHGADTFQSGQDKLIDGAVFKTIQKTVASNMARINTEENTVIPIYQHYNSPSEFMLLTGISIIDNETATAVSLLHQLGMPVSMVEFSTYRPVYLTHLLETYKKNINLSPKRLATQYGKSYKQVQMDSKLYFGTTLYDFILKLKMLDAIDDLMFTDLTLKEIAFQNNFTDYSSMYRLFNKLYNFPLQQIPRFLHLI